jgi:kynurenine formamidase
LNLDQIGRPHSFQLIVMPVKWVGTTAAPVRAVAIVDD